MNPTILNREFKHPADGWYHIEPAGRHFNAGLGATQVIDAAAVSAIVSAFNRAAAASPAFPGMLVDHEHFRHDAKQESRAYGWLMELQGRDDGIYGKINWTGTGEPAVNRGDYRFFSTEYEPGDFETISETEKRPLKLAGLTLTNDPNNKGARPITNRREDKTPAQKDKSMKKIAEKLGLAPEATEDEIVAAIGTALDENKALKEAAKVADAAVVNREVEALGVTDPDEKAEVTAIIKNSADRAKTLKVLKNRFAAKPLTVIKPVTNRAEAKTPASAPVVNRAAAQNALVSSIKNSRRCSFEQAWELAKAEKPELFTEDEQAS